MIAEHIGADLSRLISELEKVMISLPDDNRRITPEIVEREIGVSKDFNVFELKTAIIERNVFKANQIVKYLTKSKGRFTVCMSAFTILLLPEPDGSILCARSQQRQQPRSLP